MALYLAGIKLYALFNAKAGKWVKGRKDWRNQLAAVFKNNEQRIWIHASSLGEFEQGRPIIEKLKQQYPHYKIVLTFFSPSGYEVRKNYELADYVFYLPMDGKRNAKDFIQLVNPSLAIFIKYEFWYYYLNELRQKNIPSILVSAAFREGQGFFKWYGSLFRKMLHSFNCIFVQDDNSKQLLSSININENVIVSGDTRYDRVAEIAAQVKEIKQIADFKGNRKLIIAGSTWPDDEKILQQCITALPAGWKLVIAPHEIDAAHISQVKSLFADSSVLFSEMREQAANDKKILIIDNIGMLSSIYAYGDIAYIGGGFQKGGIHNILEPAVFGIPVVFGPVYEKFVEAKEMVDAGLAFPVNDASACIAQFKQLMDDANRSQLNIAVKSFMAANTGATNAVLQVLLDNYIIR